MHNKYIFVFYINRRIFWDHVDFADVEVEVEDADVGVDQVGVEGEWDVMTIWLLSNWAGL